MKIFLKPDWRKLLLFSAFILLAVAGQTQAWGFDDEPQTKPPFYDLLRPFPYIWFIWIFSMLPLVIISTPFRSLIQNTGFDGSRLWWIALVIYYYALSCSLFALVALFKSRDNR